MTDGIIVLLAGLPDYNNNYGFNNLDVTVAGLNDPFDGNIVQFQMLYNLNKNDYFSFQKQNAINDEIEYADYLLIGQTTSDAYIATDKNGKIFVLDFDCTYVGSEDNAKKSLCY